MRIKHENTKIKMKFYKNITLPDIILGLFMLNYVLLNRNLVKKRQYNITS